MALGIILVVVGVLLLANNFLQGTILGLGGWLVFAGPGVVFLATYFLHTRHLGFLIPGAVLTALGVLFVLEGVELFPQSAGLFFLFLGLPFLFVWYVHTRHLEGRQERTWPLLPGAALTSLAVAFLVLEAALALRESKWATLLRFWPSLLIFVGLAFVLRAGGLARADRRAPEA